MQYSLDIDMGLLKSGHEATFEQVYNAYYSSLNFFANQYIDKNADAENLVQETFLALWMYKENLSGNTPGSIKAWLYTTLKNKCLNHLEKESHKLNYNNHQLHQYKIDIDILGHMEISEVTFDEIERLLYQALEQMPEQCRRVFELSRFKNLKNKEIADSLHISIKAVEANITRALKHLRIHLKDYLPLCILLGLL
ncbi:RNA polymerase sigma-70 factor [Carboxylicivirga sediminis]|uniref:RNA polymerase sigma-70 factor n=1 Tax=Carboxylicivirga sediminis TaxID=2006564 RepID=A0A941F4N9_9BACT|nr:RNA polymerase sigma-70 factor [Carboxylicivirga sediminis]MBR8536342.1 RNA polymerase sigma-70 factor [Carboxylicivirga sediminis]